MSQQKMTARLHELVRARAPWHTMRPESGNLPGIFVLEFRQASGPGILSDGRELRAVLTPAELASVLGAIPALSLAGDDENLRAVLRIVKLLEGGKP